MARRHYAPVTKATHDEAQQMDLEDARHRVDQDFPTGRLANFGAGHRDARPDNYIGNNWSEQDIRTVEAERRHQLMSDKDY